MSLADPIMLLRCPRCGSEYDPEQFRGGEVPRCIEWCEPFDDEVPAGQVPTLEPVYRSDLLADGR